MLDVIVIIALSVVVGVLGVLLLRRRASAAPVTLVHTTSLADRVRSVGKLVGLEVHAKEIATSTKGWSWMPSLLLSQAKIAMIFHFEKQYFVDLSKMRAEDVQTIDESPSGADGRPRYRIRMPSVEGSLRLTDVSPYDIQAGRVLGLIDVIQMTAETQGELMRSAQEQAADLFKKSESRYIDSARRSIEHHLEALFRMFEVDAQIVWGDQSADGPEHEPRLELGDTMARRLVKA